ncbi:MAG: head completion/stabilization protein [Pseudodesulfovibrio sp.]|nr:head completion/stabilization protein [Pseudodesulfovibrio sp.]
MSFSGNSNADSTTTVSNDGWWPDLGVAEFQSRYRMPKEYAEKVLIDGLQIGMAWANEQLEAWRVEQEATGSANLAAVESPKLGNESLKLIHYRRAVFSHAKAYLLQQFPTINRREASGNEARESDDTEDKFLEYAQAAIASFLGKGFITAELI